VGGDAQTKAMRQVSGSLRIDLAQYRELAAFAQFGSDLDPSTRARLERGQRATEVLKQPEFDPLSMHEQVEILFALGNGYLDDVPVERIMEFQQEFRRFMEASHKEIADALEEQKAVTPEIEQQLRAALDEFKRSTQFVEPQAGTPAAAQ
jgi:F-type H+-transporting ATPase subunit alpha